MNKKAALIPLIIVGIIGVAFYVVYKFYHPPPPPPPPCPPVVAGKDYYVLATLIEFSPRRLSPKHQGDLWDSGTLWGDSEKSPDIFYQIHWQGNVIYKSPVEKDTLIGRWSALTADIIDIIRNQGVSPAKVVKAAKIQARLPHEPGSDFVVKAYDKDLDFDDPAGSRTFTMVDLCEGDQDFISDGHELRRIRIRVVHQEKPLAELLAELGQP